MYVELSEFDNQSIICNHYHLSEIFILIFEMQSINLFELELGRV